MLAVVFPFASNLRISVSRSVRIVSFAGDLVDEIRLIACSGAISVSFTTKSRTND